MAVGIHCRTGKDHGVPILEGTRRLPEAPLPIKKKRKKGIVQFCGATSQIIQTRAAESKNFKRQLRNESSTPNPTPIPLRLLPNKR